MTLAEMASAMNGKIFNCPKNILDAAPTGISIDSRTLKKGELFFAIKGKNFDGHNFTDSAAERGAIGCVVSALADKPATAGKSSMPKTKMPAIEVPDTTEALGRLGGAFALSSTATKIGITGSTGKTTTKDFLKKILSDDFKTLASEGNLNNIYGLPLTLSRIKGDEDALICEMGISAPGEMKKLAEIYVPDIMIFTAVSPVHLEFFPSVEAIAREKTSVLSFMKKDGAVIFNGDNLYLAFIKKEFSGEKISFGFSADCDVRAENFLSRGFDGSQFDVKISDIAGLPRPDKIGARNDGNRKFSVKAKVGGEASAMNILAAIAAALYLGVDTAKTAERAEEIENPVGRGRVLSLKNDIRAVDDTYNSNPAALKIAIKTLCETPNAKRYIVVSGDMLELGEAAEKMHREAGEDGAKCGISVFIGVGELSKSAVSGAKNGGAETHWAPTSEDAANIVLKIMRAGDIILVKGSRGMRTEKIVEKLKAEAL